MNTIYRMCTHILCIKCNILIIITKHSSALYIGMAKALPIIDVLGYDGGGGEGEENEEFCPS